MEFVVHLFILAEARCSFLHLDRHRALAYDPAKLGSGFCDDPQLDSLQEETPVNRPSRRPAQTKKCTPSNLSAGMEKRLSAYAIAAGSAGVALLACVQPSEAKIVTTTTNIIVPINGGLVQFDINGDGQVDFGLSAFAAGSTCTFTQGRVKRGTPPPLGCPFDDQLKVVPAQAANEVWQHGTSYGAKCAADLVAGVKIGPVRPFAANAMVMWGISGTSAGHSFCPWKPSTPPKPYLGVKFVDTSGNFHFGWVRVSVSGINATIHGSAYETVPNKAIIAGQTSGADSDASLLNPSTDLIPRAAEPASLGRLAQGAEGLSAWRREDEVVAR
jgi:hypothetical protein